MTRYYEYVSSNIVKASRPVIKGRTGDALPVVGVDTDYADGAEVAFGLFVASATVITLQLDANSNIIKTGGEGTLYTEIDIANGLTLTDYYYSIMYNDGSGFVQIYGDGANGITLSEPVAGTARLDMNLDTLTNGINVYGISEQLGRLPVLNDVDILTDATGSLGYGLTSSGYIILESGLIFQWGQVISSSTAGSGKTEPLPINFPNAAFVSVANHIPTGAFTAAESNVNQISITVRAEIASATLSYMAIGY